MTDSKAAGELIRKLRKAGHSTEPHGKTRHIVHGTGDKEGQSVVIPGPKQRVSGRALSNARAELRRVLGIEV